ncbi:MAG: RraA family protein [Anaerolineae bacterium]|nr:RraA family protein [Anaerolineae bacterium]
MKDQKREELLAAYADLRVCDVRDAMDALGYFHYGSLDARIRPLWRTRAYGLARTARYLPYTGPVPRMSAKEYREKWSGIYYHEICTYPWCDDVEEGDFIVIDQSGLNVGLMGSDNSFGCFNAGARGFVSNGGVRDTDELLLQKIPFWSRYIGQTMVQVRLQFEAKNIPIAVGRVQVRPDDMVVADGDGVIVVPQEIALEAAEWAHEEHESDKKARRKHYLKAGMELDDTVK